MGAAGLAEKVMCCLFWADLSEGVEGRTVLARVLERRKEEVGGDATRKGCYCTALHLSFTSDTHINAVVDSELVYQ